MKKKKIFPNNICRLHQLQISSYCDNEDCGMIMCRKCSVEHSQKEAQHAEKKTSFPDKMNPILSKYYFIRFLGKSSSGDNKLFEIEFENKKRSLKWVDFSEIVAEFEDKEQKNKFIEDMHRDLQKEIELLRSFNCEYIMQTSNKDNQWLETETDFIMILDHVKMNLKAACASLKKKENKHQKMVDWFYQISRGVQYIHKIGVIHRNLKPQHIYVTEKDKILISGFINAKEDSEQIFEINTEEFLGTPVFMAPEIQNNKVNPIFTKPAEIWTLGIIYHMMLAGNNPYKKDNLIISKNIRRRADKDVLRK